MVEQQNPQFISKPKVRKRTNSGMTASKKMVWDVTVEVEGEIGMWETSNAYLMELQDDLTSQQIQRWGDANSKAVEPANEE